MNVISDGEESQSYKQRGRMGGYQLNMRSVPAAMLLCHAKRHYLCLLWSKSNYYRYVTYKSVKV